MPLRPGDIYQFAEFTLDPSRRSLERDGETIPLPAKVFDLLLFMVENPGRLLTRDEILQTIWPDTVVEEGSLTHNVFLVRKSLGESSAEQRHVVTVSGRGYQFTARVKKRTHPSEKIEDFPYPDRSSRTPLDTTSDRPAPRLVASAIPLPAPAAKPAPAPPALVMPVPRPSRRWIPITLALFIVFAIGATLAYLHFRTIPARNIHLLLADLDNSTGDPTFDHALNRALQIDLQQSPSLALFSDGRVRTTMKQMQLDPTARLTGEPAREACERLNGHAVIEPTIANIGGQYLLTLTARACDDGRTLGDRKQTTASKAGILVALDKLADGIRRDIGESRASIFRYNKPLYEAETPSLDALKAYTEAGRLFNQGQLTQAIPLYERALALDPKMAIAYADLSSVYFNLGDKQRDTENITRAYQLRDTVSDRYRFYIEQRYHQSVTGDLSKAIHVLKQFAAVFPHDATPRFNLSNLENWTANYKQAVRYADEAMTINHAEGIYNAIGSEIAARAYAHDNMPDRAIAIGNEALQKSPSAGMLGVLIQVANVRHDDAEIDRLIALSRGTPSEPHVLQEAAAAALAEGRVHRSQDLANQARTAAQREKSEDDLVDLDATRARYLVDIGLPDQALATLNALPKMDDAMDGVYAMAEVGDPAKAAAIANQRVKDEPNNEMLVSEYSPAVHAAIAMRNNKPADALNIMAADSTYTMRDPTAPYLIAQAYLADNKPQLALDQFKKILDNPGIADPSAPLYALSYLGTARAHAALGQTADAIAGYRAFFTYWWNADPELPVLQQARAELAKLQPPPPAAPKQ